MRDHLRDLLVKLKPALKLKLLVFLCMATLATCLLLYTSDFIPSWGAWHSADNRFQILTSYLEQGKLSSSLNPQDLEHDYSWNGAKYQHWSLGIPVLRLPFDILAKKFGYQCFPDRLLFIGIYFFLAMFTFRSCFLAFSHRNDQNYFRTFFDYLWAYSLGLILLVSPPFVFIVASRFHVNEEAVAYCNIIGMLIVALLIRLSLKPTCGFFFFLCFLAGIAVFFRATGATLGASAVLVAVALIWQKLSLKIIASGIIIATSGVFLALYSNFIRFGKAFEFGYSLNVSKLIVDSFSLRFGYPFQFEPLSKAFYELIGALFFVTDPNIGNLYKANFFPFQSETMRFREMTIPGFSALHFFSIGFVLFSFMAYFILKPTNSEQTPHTHWKKLAFVTGGWGALSFLALFSFYLRSPSIAARYIADFCPTVSAIMLSGIFLLKYLGTRRTIFAAIALTACILLGQIWSILNPIFSPATDHPAKNFSSTIPQFPELIPRSTFSGYQCGDDLEKTRIFGNGQGWNYLQDCKVSEMSQFFIDDANCVKLDLISDTTDQIPAKSLDLIQLKVGLSFYELVSQKVSGSKVSMTFCAKADSKVTRGLALVSVAWISPKDLYKPIFPPFRLLRIATTQGPNKR